MFRRIFVAVVILLDVAVLTAVVLWMRAPIVGACEEWTPLATRVERTDIIVVGHITFIEPKKYSVQLPESDFTPRGGKADAKRTRWLDDATVVVTDVLKGKPEFLATEVTAEGDTVRSVHLLLDGLIERSDGMWESISTDDNGRVGDEGAWFLHAGEVKETYRSSSRASLGGVETLRKCLHTLATNYAGWTPGFAPDPQTQLVTLSSYGGPNTLVDPDGSVILLGMYRDNFVLAGKQWFASADWDYFIARLAPTGDVSWCRAIGCKRGASLGLFRGLGDTVLLVADVYDTCSVLDSTMPFNGSPTQMVINLSGDGQVLWTCPVFGRVENLWVSRHGDIYRMGGAFQDEVTCANQRIRAEQGTDWFVGALDAQGRPRELRAVVLPGVQQAIFARMRSDGAVVMGGGVVVPVRGESPPRSDCDAFLSVISQDGRELWADTLGGRWSDGLWSIAVAPDGMVVATIMMQGDAVTPFVYGDAVRDTRLVRGAQSLYLCAWSAEGERLWNVPGGGSTIAFGDDGTIYCAGSYGEPGACIAPNYLSASAGDQDVFIECYDRQGRRLWARRDGGLGAETATGLHLLPGHRALLVGTMDAKSFLAGRVVEPPGGKGAFVLSIALPTERDAH